MTNLKLLLRTYFLMTITLLAQTINETEEHISSLLLSDTGYKYYIISIKAENESFSSGNYIDPENLLDNCYIFNAIPDPMDVAPATKGFIGIFKDNQIIWKSPHVINVDISFTNWIEKVQDLNNDGSVEIITVWPQGMSGYMSEIWIVSWDGKSGHISNSYNEMGNSKILVVSDTWEVVTIGVEEEYKIKAITENSEGEVERIYSWIGNEIGDFGQLVPNSYPRSKLNVVVSASLFKQNNKIQFCYTVENEITSQQSIEEFAIDCYVDSLKKAIKTPRKWEFSNILDQGVISWQCDVFYSDSYHEALIHPNGYSKSFIYEGLLLPKIAKYYIKGNNGALSLDINDLKHNSVHGYSIGANDYPLQLILQEFLDTLTSYTFQSFELSWIKNETTYNKYNTFLTDAKTALEQSDTNSARTYLQNIITNVDIDSSLSLTSEAYALLKFNTEYLLDQLPEINIEDMFDILLNHVSECYDKEWIDNKGIMNSLTKKVERAKTDYLKGKIKTAVNKLNSFRNELNAQKDKHLNSECYDLLFSYSNYIIEKLQ